MKEYHALSPTLAFMIVFFLLGELGEELNTLEGIYLVGIGWNESSVGLAISLMGLTSLIILPWAGDCLDKTTVDRRVFLIVAAIVTGVSATVVLFVHTGNTDHSLIFATKLIEGVSSSFIEPCLAALTLATFGPNHFDAVMSNNIMWAHYGSVFSSILAGFVAYRTYPFTKYCFLVIGGSALAACGFVPFLPEGDVLMGRGFQGKLAIDEQGQVERLDGKMITPSFESTGEILPPPDAAKYWEVISDTKTIILCLTGFFFHFANANVLLVLGELMEGIDNGAPRRNAIPLIAGAMAISQFTMGIVTWAGDRLTAEGFGRKPLAMAGLIALPIRCALIIGWAGAGDEYLLATQILDGIGNGMVTLVHPFLVADITFGTGRFNVILGLSASFFGLGATLSNFLGQMVAENFGHIASLALSLVLSLIPIVLFMFMPETLGKRVEDKDTPNNVYKSMA